MKYKVWICVESCDEEYEQYEDVEVPFAKAAGIRSPGVCFSASKLWGRHFARSDVG